MGLDMYLYVDRYVPGWRQDSDAQRDEYERLISMFGMKNLVTDHAPSATVRFTVAYWRKANAIHGWFVREVQGGVDECQLSDVSQEELKELRTICLDVLLTKEKYGEKIGADRGMELLPPVEGFFFGVYDINRWYWENLEETVTQLDRALSLPNDWMWNFHYRSSW